MSHSHLNAEIIWIVLFGILLALIIPIYTFFILKKKLSNENSGAIAAAYGSVSAVTFVTAIAFLEFHKFKADGYMVAVMALMEAPAIIIGVMLIRFFGSEKNHTTKITSLIFHSFTNGSVLLILGSLLIGFVANDKAAEGIKPFTTDMFKGFLAIFLLDMGITSGKKLEDFFKNGWFTAIFAIVVPLVNGSIVAYSSQFVTTLNFLFY